MMTGVGVMLGTAAYMSPEQAEARRPTSAATSGRSAVSCLRDAHRPACVRRRRRDRHAGECVEAGARLEPVAGGSPVARPGDAARVPAEGSEAAHRRRAESAAGAGGCVRFGRGAAGRAPRRLAVTWREAAGHPRDGVGCGCPRSRSCRLGSVAGRRAGAYQPIRSRPWRETSCSEASIAVWWRCPPMAVSSFTTRSTGSTSGE